ncbi:phosphatidylinositol phosphate kinase [Acrasis kona]|uniref:Phosphatidylinositol phosphate kinase n=1 Tax=Acrasis kona TaxID=1008807 RepID=A0AAW2ZTB0_9EUKA
MEDDDAVYASTIAPISPVVTFDVPLTTTETPTPTDYRSVETPRTRSRSIMTTKTVLTPQESGSLEDKAAKKKWHVNGMGHVIYKEHNSYNLMKQIQMGIRTSVSSINTKKDREVNVNKDMADVLKLDFPKRGSLKTPPHQFEHFKFYDYSPYVFRKLRKRFNIEPEHLLVSLCHDKSLSILGTPGKSGALFFFSADMEYILKTVTKKESKFLRKVLPQYYNHAMTNPNTLITRFYGLFSIKPKDNKNNVRFIIMNNVFDTKFFVEERYDLKGSTIGRTASENERKRETPILKDLDFLDSKRKLFVGKEVKDRIMKQLDSDCKFLETLKIMDYSVLLGCHKVSDEDVEVFSPCSLASIHDTLSTDVVPLSPTDETTPKDHPSKEDTEAKPPPPPLVNEQVTPDDVSNKDQAARPSLQNVNKRTMTSSTNVIDLFKVFKVRNSDVSLEKHFQGDKISEFQRFHGGILSEPLDKHGNREIYFFGVIDVLQPWTSVKQMENVFKGLKYDRDKISAVNPKNYATRFKMFVNDMLV